MIKLFAILAVFAAFPFSALAEMNTPPALSGHCAKDGPDVYASQVVTPEKPTVQGNTNDANTAI